jgi:hypothetical protein
MRGLTCFGRFFARHQERTAALAASGFTVAAWRSADHDQQRSNRHAPTVKPEAPSAVVRSR